MKNWILVGACMLFTGCAANDGSSQDAAQSAPDRLPHPVTPSPNETVPATVDSDPNTSNAPNIAGNPNDPNGPVTRPPSPFLSLVNKQLSWQGNPITLVGYQASLPNVNNYCGWTSAQLTSAMNAMNAMDANSHANAVRVWFLESAGGPGNWTAFDTFIQQAKAHHLLIIATLVNQWGDCEPPFDQANKNYKTLSWYQTGYKLANDGYPLAYRDYAKAVAQRYAGETAIGIWQLVNEAEARDPNTNTCPSQTDSANAIRAFADDMVDVIHSVDTNHLINLGTQDNGYCGVSGSNFQQIHAGKVDLCEVHSYEAANLALPTPMTSLVDKCKAIGKPTFLGEVGICRNVKSDGSCPDPNDMIAADANSLQRRAAYFDAKFKASINYGLAGVLIWQLSPNADATYGVFPGDPVAEVVSKY